MPRRGADCLWRIRSGLQTRATGAGARYDGAMPRHAVLLLLVALLLPAERAWAQAVDRNKEDCLKVIPYSTDWRSTSQLHCLRFDPMRTRRDPFGRCQERRFEVELRNACEFPIIAHWRFNNGMREQHKLLGPSQVLHIDCGQVSDRCEGDVIAYADRLRY